jgi:hypothetical protein
MTTKVMPLAGALAILLCAGTPGTWADGNIAPGGAGPEKIGVVHFPVSCSKPAQADFDRGLALYHSFWFDPAIEAFAKTVQDDPECGMAYWGIALSTLGNPFAWPPNRKALHASATALSEAQRIGAKTQRERDYIAALAAFYKDWDTTDHRPRVLALEKAMQNLSAGYPRDDEAQIFYALVLDATALPTDKSFANQTTAATILEPLFKKYPSHPGVAHYLIHTYDYTPLAEKGLPSARAYSGIAPSVPHALHMPAHIYARLGMWQETVEANKASAAAARSELTESKLNVGTYNALHAMDYMMYGHLQQAQDKAAKQLVDEVRAIRKVDVENFVAAYALAAIPARYALERGDWQQAALLTPSPRDLPWNKFPQAEAITLFAQGLGAARSGNIKVARRDVEQLRALRDSMTEAATGYWAAQTEIQIRIVLAWIALAENHNDEALRIMRSAADAEEATDKHPVTPGPIVPARELLGEMLMALDRPGQALPEFEHSLKRDPNRFRALYGAARAAEADGNGEAANEYYAKLLAVSAGRDTDRPELAHAKASMASR